MKEEQENKLAEIYFVKDQFSYMKSFVESLLEEQKKELAEKVDKELRGVLAQELPIFEKKIREEQKKELLDLVEKEVENYIQQNRQKVERLDRYVLDELLTIINQLRV